MQGECDLQSLTFYGTEKVSYMFLLLENSMCIRYYVLEFLPSFQKKKKKKTLCFYFENHQMEEFVFYCYQC